jgi:pyruvate dehydrogenase E2 component (dihydrolipoamide acetyltransferase)
MSQIFELPDLGEGLPDAEIVRWFVNVGDVVEAEQLLVEMETAKAVVEVNSPQSGRITKLHGNAGDVIETGAPLVTFGNAEEFRSAQKTTDTEEEIPEARSQHVAGAKPGVSPPVQALARKLKVDLNKVEASGKNNMITLHDVRAAAEQKTAVLLAEPDVDADEVATASANTIAIDFGKGVRAMPRVRAAARQSGIDIGSLKATGHQDNVTLKDLQNKRVHHPATQVAGSGEYKPPKRNQEITGKPQPIRGERRSMALNMAKARDTTVNTTICEKADISAWPAKMDVSGRMLRAVTAACIVEPSLNAWFDGEKMERTLHATVDIGIAVDSPHGLSVPVIRATDSKSIEELRAELNRLREAVYAKTIKPQELQHATITLSNFGMIAGLYATPIVIPPQVAIVATGRIMEELKLTEQGVINGRFIPVSLSFDHRGATGADAARFLAAFVADLSLPY